MYLRRTLNITYTESARYKIYRERSTLSKAHTSRAQQTTRFPLSAAAAAAGVRRVRLRVCRPAAALGRRRVRRHLQLECLKAGGVAAGVHRRKDEGLVHQLG